MFLLKLSSCFKHSGIAVEEAFDDIDSCDLHFDSPDLPVELISGYQSHVGSTEPTECTVSEYLTCDNFPINDGEIEEGCTGPEVEILELSDAEPDSDAASEDDTSPITASKVLT